MGEGLRTHLIAAVSALAFWIGLGTVSFMYLEGWNWIDSFYFSVTTLSTVGYGDIYPTTQISRLFTAFYIIFGVAVVFASLGFLGAKYLEGETKFLNRRRRKKSK